MDTSAQSVKLSNSTSAVVFISRMAMPVAVSLLLIGCDTVQTEGPSRASASPSTASMCGGRETAYSRAAAAAAAPAEPSPEVSADAGTNRVSSVVTVTPKKPTPPPPQPAPVVVQQSHPAEAQVVASASPSPGKASEKLMPSKASAPAEKSAQKVATTATVPSAPPVAQAKAQPVSAAATPVDALIVKGPPHPVKQHAQGVGKVVWIGLAVFGIAVLLLGTRVSVDRPVKVSTGRRKNKRSKKAKAGDDDVVLPPELEMRESTGIRPYAEDF